MDMGRRLALEDGISKPTTTECLHCGFCAAARSSPLELPETETAGLIRRSLFELDETIGEMNLGKRQIGWERYWDANEPHLADPSEEVEDWLDWLWGPNNSFFYQVAKRKRALGGEFDIEEFRRIVLELGWDFYLHVSDCLRLMMKAFALALPDHLDPRERQIFEQMHLPQPHFGDFPLIFLAERFGFCSLAIRDVVENPGDQRAIAVFHRQLSNYAILAPERRQVDRSVKREPIQKFEGNDDPSSDGRTDHASRRHELRAEEIAALARSYSIVCQYGTPAGPGWTAWIEQGKVVGGLRNYTIILTCADFKCELVIKGSI